MKNKTDNSILPSILFGAFFPVVSFGYGFIKPRRGFSISIVLFFAFYGYSILWTNDNTDIYVYGLNFIDASSQSLDFGDYLNTVTYGGLDYYWAFMTWLVSRFTDNVHVYFCILAAVYGIFAAANVNYIVSKVNIKNIKLLLLLFVLIPGFVFITHRWWTALQIFLFGLLPVLFEKRYNRILFCVASAFLVHFSFIYPLVLLLLAIFLPQKTIVPYLVLFYISLVLSKVDFSFIEKFLFSYMPSSYAERTIGYINSELQEHSFLSMLNNLFLTISNVLISTYICFNKEALDDKQKTSLKIALLIATFANVCAMTEWGDRYLILSNTLFMAVYIYVYSTSKSRTGFNRLINRCTPLFVFVLIFQIWGFLHKIGPIHFFFGNLISIWFLNTESMSVFDFLF